MDGTLLNENIEVTPRAADAILRLQDAGIEFAVATGRTLESGYSLVKEHGITCAFVELNGARLFDENEELQFTREISKEDTKELIRILDNYDIQNEFITQEVTYSNQTVEDYVQSFMAVYQSINEELADEAAIEAVRERLTSMNIQTVDTYDFLYQDPNLNVLKVIANAAVDDDVSILADIQADIEAQLPDLIVTSAGPNNIEVNSIHANKGKAVAEYAAARGFKADEVITIGDNLNDLTMLEWSEHSYAVENAHPRAKEVATYLAPSHTEHAVVQIIERVLDGKNLAF